MGTTADLELGRAAFDGRAWVQARDRLSSADRGGALEPEDLERLATAQFLTGHAHDSTASWARAFHGWTACGPGERAARCGFWLAFTLSCIGESARSAGWAERARRLLGPDRPECAERGYLMLLDAIRRGGGRITGGERSPRSVQALEDVDVERVARHLQDVAGAGDVAEHSRPWRAGDRHANPLGRVSEVTEFTAMCCSTVQFRRGVDGAATGARRLGRP
jgi:hypothetical protein